MARKPKIDRSRAERGSYLLEWRQKKGMTLAEVCARLDYMAGEHPEYRKRLPTTGASLSRVEQGLQPWSQPILEALAEIYSADKTGDLIDMNPLKERKVVDFVARLTEREQQQVMALAKAMLENAAKG